MSEHSSLQELTSGPAEASAAATVLVVDEDEFTRRGVREVLEAEGDLRVVGEAASVADAVATLESTAPDVAVVDLRLPDGDGVEVCREIRSRHPETRCVLLTAHDDDRALVAAAIAGAAGVVSKQVRGPGLVDAVRKALAAATVLVVDDHELTRRGVREVLEAEGDLRVVGEAASVADAVATLESTAPDVAVVDLRLPDGDGVEVCREIRSRHPETRCVLLTAHDDDRALVAAAIAGAAGVVSKQVRGPGLVDAVRKAVRGESLPPGALGRAADRLRGTPEGDVLRFLTHQERLILDLIGTGLTNREIGEQMDLAEKTVKNYVSNLLVKLGMHRRTEVAALAARLEERRHNGDASDGSGRVGVAAWR